MNTPDISKMTLREKIAQVLVVRMSDLVMYADSAYTKFRDNKEAAALAEKYQYGGVWLHGNIDVNQMNNIWNENVNFTSEALRKWFEELGKNVKIPMLAASDIGLVSSELNSFGGIDLCVGASNSDDIAYELGQCVATEHKLAGINWIWAPVVDNLNSHHAHITRCFSDDADTISRCGINYMKGYQSVNVAACAKHFPGADKNDLRDGHIITTNIDMPLDEWWENQGRIFQNMIDAGVDTIMTSGLAFPALDDTKINGRYVPASFSHKIVTEYLKDKMGFEGVVISDGVRMGCYTSFYTGGKLYAELLNAGHDMLLGVGVDAVDILEAEVEKGTVSIERIEDACQRVLKLKAKLGLFSEECGKQICTVEEAKAKTQKMSQNLAQTSITLVRDDNKKIPFDKEKIKKVAIICYTHEESAFDNLTVMKETFEQYGCEVLLRRRLENFGEADSIASENDLIVYVGYIAFHAPKGFAGFYGDEFWSLRYAFKNGKEKSIGVSFGYPHLMYNFMNDTQMFVNAYSLTPETQRAFVKGIFGDIEFVGKSPVVLD